jgi:hypothetical protein
MKYTIPGNTEEIIALSDRPISEELVATAIAGVVKIARNQGQSLEDLKAEVLREDPILDQVQRRWLSQLVSDAWGILP